MANSLEGPLIVTVSAWIVFLTALAASRILARSKLLPDHPNHRSSHERVTSKAGGLAIMGAWLAGVFVVGVFSDMPETAVAAAKLALLGSGALLIGVVDDRWDVSPLLKLSAQAALAALFVVLFSPLQYGPIPFIGVAVLGVAGIFITIFWIVAFMNAFNFMDGSNGLAAGSAAVGLGGFSTIASFAGQSFVAVAAIFMAVAVFGFLPSNMKRGNLFMGDNGSQAISFMIAVLAVLAANWSKGTVSALVVPVIFLPFLFDVTVTLAHRFFRKQKILAAHREHLYQLMLRLGASHARVAVIYMTLTAFSTGVAVFMLAAPPAYQWLAPGLLMVCFGVGALRITSSAKRAGLFAEANRPLLDVEVSAPQPVAE